MARLADEDLCEIEVNDIEFGLPRPSYTIDILTYLSARYPQHVFYLIIGSDNLNSLKKWKNYELLLRDYHFLVYPRPGFDNSGVEDHTSETVTVAPLMEVSSTFIRR